MTALESFSPTNNKIDALTFFMLTTLAKSGRPPLETIAYTLLKQNRITVASIAAAAPVLEPK